MDTDIDLTVGEIFEGLTPDTLKAFEALGHKGCYPLGTILFGAAEPCCGIFCVCSGEVIVSVSDGTGECVASRVARIGELLGLKAALCGATYGSKAQSNGPSELNFVNQDDLLAFLSRHPDVAFRILQQLSVHLGAAVDQLRSAPSNSPKPPN